MKDRIQEQIINEIKQGAHSETPMVVIAIVVSFIFLGLASGFAGGAVETGYRYGKPEIDPLFIVIMCLAIIGIIVINLFTVRSLLLNKARRAKLTEGLMKIYQEEGVSQYIDNSSLKTYEARYNIYSIVLTTIGIIGIAMPLLILFRNLYD